MAAEGFLCLSWWGSDLLPQDEDKHKAPASATPHPLVPTPLPGTRPFIGVVALAIPPIMHQKLLAGNIAIWSISPYNYVGVQFIAPNRRQVKDKGTWKKETFKTG